MPILRLTAAALAIGLSAAGVGAQQSGGQKTPAQTPPATQRPAGAQSQPAPPKPPTAQTPAAPGAQTPPAARRPRRRPAAEHVIVRDFSGTPIEGVQVTVSGVGGTVPAENTEAMTAADGTALLMLPDGQYRLRFEQDRFVTLEREVTIRNGEPSEIDIALRNAPPPPPPPPAPAPPPAPVRPAPRPAAPSGPPVTISIPSFLEKNFIGREPLKESILGCTPEAMTRLLQLHDPVAVHTHDDLDEILYVVAGEGTVRIRDTESKVTAGSLSIIPRGLPHGLQRTGKNPLIVLSTLAGAPCPQSADQTAAK
jgi:mannose-6-phosphate isomerase-like protein (cupin superfamily)